MIQTHADLVSGKDMLDERFDVLALAAPSFSSGSPSAESSFSRSSTSQNPRCPNDTRKS